jgi:DNA-binding NtrC family response regulator
VARCHLAVLSGAARGRELLVTGDACRIGKAPDNHLVIDDETVSRYHCELIREPRGWLLRDAGSTNGTQLDGAEIREAFLKNLSVVTVGTVQIRVRSWVERLERKASASDHFGDALGDSRVMRELFGFLERLAPSETSVLLTGEAGTGRALLARALHGQGPRAGRVFVKVDCAEAPPLLEGELFGSERAAGAVGRFGVLEAASGGTVFLADVGALPLDLQPRLQRALAERQVRRAGSARPARIDVRVVASARPDLPLEVERGRFSRELLFRLSAATVEVPPLRARLDDVPRLVQHFLARSSPDGAKEPLPDAVLSALSRHDWPGNLPELLAVTLRAASGEPVPFGPFGPFGTTSSARAFSTGTTFKAEKDRWEAQFERTYVEWLLGRTGGNISQAAREANMDRKHLHKLMRKHGLGKRP